MMVMILLVGCRAGCSVIVAVWCDFFLFSFATRAGSPQQREPITLGPCYLAHPSQLPVGGNRSTRGKPTTFGRALTILFSHEDWFRIHIKMTLLGIELGTLEVKGEWSDHYTTEAPVW